MARFVFVTLLGIMLAVGVAWAAPGDPFGGDDQGFIPSTTAFALCETKLGGLAAKLVICLMKCHESRSKEKIDATQEEVCEDSCKTSYTNKFSLITGCPACLTPTSVSNYGDNVRNSTD